MWPPSRTSSFALIAVNVLIVALNLVVLIPVQRLQVAHGDHLPGYVFAGLVLSYSLGQLILVSILTAIILVTLRVYDTEPRAATWPECLEIVGLSQIPLVVWGIVSLVTTSYAIGFIDVRPSVEQLAKLERIMNVNDATKMLAWAAGLSLIVFEVRRRFVLTWRLAAALAAGPVLVLWGAVESIAFILT